MGLRRIIIGAGILFMLAIHPLDSLLGDEAYYILLSREFASRGFIATVFTERLTQIHYYFFLPLVLAPFNFLTQLAHTAMRIVPLVSALVSAGMFYSFARKYSGVPAVGLLTAAYVLNPWTVIYAGSLLTEMPYMALSMAALYGACLYAESPRARPLVAAAVCAGLSVCARPPGVALAIGLVIWLLFLKRWRHAAIASGILVFMALPLLLQASQLFSSVTKGIVLTRDFFDAKAPQLGLWGMGRRIAYNAFAYAGNYTADLFLKPLVESVGPRLANSTFNPLFALKLLSSAGLVLLMVKGFLVSRRREGLQLLHVYTVAYLPLLCLSSVYVARYLYVVLPVMLLLLYEGIRSCRKVFRIALWVVIMIVSVCGSLQRVIEARSGYLSPRVRSFLSCNEWVKQNTPPGSTILSRKGNFTELYTGRRSFSYAFTDDFAWQLDYIRQRRVDYLIIGNLGVFPGGHEAFERLIAAYPQYFTLVYTATEEPHSHVWQVHSI